MSHSEDYEITFSEKNLKVAWDRVLSSPILDTKDRLGLKIFSSNTETHLKLLQEKLLNGEYRPSKAYTSTRAKNNNANRILSFLTVQDRIVYQCIGHTIIKNCYDNIIQHNQKIFAHVPTTKDATNENEVRRRFFTFLPLFKRISGQKSQYDKFKQAVLNDIEEFKSQDDVWVLETDITGFYPSLDHHSIGEMLTRNKWLQGTDTLDLLKCCLFTWSGTNQGAPIGYETTELIATLYLLDIDMQMKHPYLRMRRFVDDMFFFIEGKKQAKQFFIDYDLAIQNKSLFLNSGKTQLRECNETLAQKITDKFKESREISLVRNNELVGVKLQPIIESLPKVSHPSTTEQIESLKSKLGLVGTILYRYKEFDENLKNIALCVLEELPIKTFQAKTYLSLDIYKQDSIILDALSAIYKQDGWYSSYRADCLDAAITIGEVKSLKVLLDKWIDEPSQDWFLKDRAIDILARNSLLDKRDMSTSIYPDYLTRSKLLYHLFQISDSIERVEIINRALSDSDYTVQALGLYLLRRDRQIDLAKINLNHLPKMFQEKLATIKVEDWQQFLDLIKKLFNLDIPQSIESQLKINIHNISDAIQALTDLQDSNSDPSDYINALDKFLFILIPAFISIQQKQKLSISMWDDIILYIDLAKSLHTLIAKLRDVKLQAKGDPQRIKNLINLRRGELSLNKIKDSIIEEFYISNTSSAISSNNQPTLAPPPTSSAISSSNQTTSAPPPTSYDIFISYRRGDSATEAEKLYEKLKILLPLYKIFLDKEEIELGKQFEYKIEDSIQSCKVVLIVIKDVDNWVKELRERHQKMEDDYVRREIELAKSVGIVIPVYIPEDQRSGSLVGTGVPVKIDYIRDLNASIIHSDEDYQKLANDIVKQMQSS